MRAAFRVKGSPANRGMSVTRMKLAMPLCLALRSTAADAQSYNNEPLQVPAKSLPVPASVHLQEDNGIDRGSPGEVHLDTGETR